MNSGETATCCNDAAISAAACESDAAINGMRSCSPGTNVRVAIMCCAAVLSRLLSLLEHRAASELHQAGMRCRHASCRGERFQLLIGGG